MKGDTLNYGGVEYVNIDGKTHSDIIDEAAKALEKFDGEYMGVDQYSNKVTLVIDSQNRILNFKEEDINLFYVIKSSP